MKLKNLIILLLLLSFFSCEKQEYIAEPIDPIMLPIDDPKPFPPIVTDPVETVTIRMSKGTISNFTSTSGVVYKNFNYSKDNIRAVQCLGNETYEFYHCDGHKITTPNFVNFTVRTLNFPSGKDAWDIVGVAKMGPGYYTFFMDKTIGIGDGVNLARYGSVPYSLPSGKTAHDIVDVYHRLAPIPGIPDAWYYTFTMFFEDGTYAECNRSKDIQNGVAYFKNIGTYTYPAGRVTFGVTNDNTLFHDKIVAFYY
jgi:hypothetical protein